MEAAEKRLARKGLDNVAEAFWLVRAIASKADIEMGHRTGVGDSWHPLAPHASPFVSKSLWKVEERGGLGLKVEEGLLMAGVAEEADLYVLGLRGEAVLMSAEEAAATGRIPRGKGAMRAWDGVLEQYKLLERAVPERGVRGTRVLGEVERRLARVRAEDDRQALPLEQVTADEEGLLKFLEKVEEGKKGALGTKLAPMQSVAAGRATEGMPRREGRRFKEECKNLLRGAFRAAKRMPAVEWEHGNPADEARFKGPHVIGVLPHREEFCTGTPARLVGMQERQAGPSPWNVDEEGYVRHKEWRLTDAIDLAELTAEREVEVPPHNRALVDITCDFNVL